MAPQERGFGSGGHQKHQGGQRPYQQGHRQDRPPDKRLDELWPDYLKEGYFEAEGQLRRDLVARDKMEPLVKAMAKAQPPLTSSQARRFFMHCRAIEAQIKAGKTTWEQQRAEFLKLDVAAADAIGKEKDRDGNSKGKIPQLFHDFIQRNVEKVRSEEDFLKGFLPHFEALIGFGSLHLTDRERN